MNYQDFIKTKETAYIDAGFECGDLSPSLKDFQRDIVRWACKRGRSAVFADTGLGKTFMQLSWARAVAEQTGLPVLVLAPLCVAQQTVGEGAKFGIECAYIREQKLCGTDIHVTNYEMLKNFRPESYGGIVLDESSILKGMDGKLRKYITGFAKTIPYRLSCTATPSPNDFMELGTQSEFLGVMSQVEMLATFFIHDGSDTSKWRLKGHARRKFWEWLSTWAVVIRKPSDLGYESEGYDLPKLNLYEHIVETEATDDLFVTVAQGLQERNKARRDSINIRCEKAAEIMAGWDCGIAWTNLNDESSLIAGLTNAVEVVGSDSIDHKELAIRWFLGDDVTVLNGNKRLRLCRGSPNTQKTEDANIESQNQRESAGDLNLEAEKKTKNICESTIKTTRTNMGEPQSSERKLTLKEEKNTQQIKNTETGKNQKSLNINEQTHENVWPTGLKSTGLALKNTNQCSNHNHSDAHCVDVQIVEPQRKSDSMLITATQPERSGDCYALTATKESANLKTTPKSLERQQNTSKILVTKPSMFGYGMNLQHCNKMVFVGLSDSFEAFYQAVRRCWRFGQTRPVDVHIVISDREGAVLDNIKRKQEQHEQMSWEMSTIMRDLTISQIKGATINKADYLPQEAMTIPNFLRG